MHLEDIEKMVLDWSERKGILSQSSAAAQCVKLREELDELDGACKELHLGKRLEAIDAVGDMLVVLTNVAHFLNTDLLSCYAVAYSQIKNRKGKMIDGIFVKES